MNLSDARERLSRAREHADSLLEAERSAEQEIGKLIARGGTDKLIAQAKQKYAEASEAATDALRVLPFLESDVKLLEQKESEAQAAARRAANKKLIGEFKSTVRRFDDATRSAAEARRSFIAEGNRVVFALRQQGFPGSFNPEDLAASTVGQRFHGAGHPAFSGDLLGIVASALSALEV